MAIQPICDFCHQELTDFGGILLSPPNEKGMVQKLHVCKSCYQKILKQNGGPNRAVLEPRGSEPAR